MQQRAHRDFKVTKATGMVHMGLRKGDLIINAEP